MSVHDRDVIFMKSTLEIVTDNSHISVRQNTKLC